MLNSRFTALCGTHVTQVVFLFWPYLLRTLVALRVLALSIRKLASIYGSVNAQGTAGSEIERYQLLNVPKKRPQPNSKHWIARQELPWASWKFYMFTMDNIERCSRRHNWPHWRSI